MDSPQATNPPVRHISGPLIWTIVGVFLTVFVTMALLSWSHAYQRARQARRDRVVTSSLPVYHVRRNTSPAPIPFISIELSRLEREAIDQKTPSVMSIQAGQVLGPSVHLETGSARLAVPERCYTGNRVHLDRYDLYGRCSRPRRLRDVFIRRGNAQPPIRPALRDRPSVDTLPRYPTPPPTYSSILTDDAKEALANGVAPTAMAPLSPMDVVPRNSMPAMPVASTV